MVAALSLGLDILRFVRDGRSLESSGIVVSLGFVDLIVPAWRMMDRRIWLWDLRKRFFVVLVDSWLSGGWRLESVSGKRCYY